MMILGQDPALPLSSVASPAFDYVALGHIHRNQVLSHYPPVVYSGSLQRINFSDEEDTKGFYVVDIEPEKSRGERIAFNFHPSKARRFLTIRVNVSHNDPDPTATILKSIARQERDIKDAIVRVQINIAEHLDGLVQEQEIHRALGEAQHVSIAKDVERERRTRLGDRSAEAMSPTEALKVYLALKKTPADRTKLLLEYADRLIQETRGED
jgi:exonuclease SbcD